MKAMHVAGIALGFILGFSLAAGAQQWMSAQSILDQSEAVRAGYVLGAYDMLRVVVRIQRPASYLSERMDCLDQQGDTVGEFRAWADAMWRSNTAEYAKDNAASLLLTDACD